MYSTLEMLEVYGPCISTANWTDWARHRKVLAAPFNETIMTFVWNESLKQAREMLQSWTCSKGPRISSVAKDTGTLSLNELAATDFYRSYEFRSSSQRGNNDESRSYRDALQTVLRNAIPLMLVSRRLLAFPLLPRSWARIGEAAEKFKQYMMDMLDEESYLLAQGRTGTGSLMTSFVRALNTQQEEAATMSHSGQTAKGLTADEIYGNIFVANLAGYDTIYCEYSGIQYASTCSKSRSSGLDS